MIMRRRNFSPWLLAIFLIASIPAAAQFPPAEPDPLARIRDAAKTNVQACSATGETLCEQVAPKIIANAQGDSPLAENLRRLRRALAAKSTATAEEHSVEWAMAAFREAGLDPRLEKYADPRGGADEQQNVVAEYRGRENPDEWVLVGAHLAPRASAPVAIDNSCDAASVIEAARDISRTAVHPKRSIRFVLFTGDERRMLGSWAYVRAHRVELDYASAAIFLQSDCRPLTGFLLNGRPEMEPGLREAMKPIESLRADHFAFRSPQGTESFDFLLEGIPALTAWPVPGTITLEGPSPVSAPVKIDIAGLKRNTAIVAVTAFGVAERADPLGPRQSRAEIESLLNKLDREPAMKAAGLWTLWQSGQRGRLP